jgi:hypothetical protein
MWPIHSPIAPSSDVLFLASLRPDSALHDAAEAGNAELIAKMLGKEKKDGEFNPVRHARDAIVR